MSVFRQSYLATLAATTECPNTPKHCRECNGIHFWFGHCSDLIRSQTGKNSDEALVPSTTYVIILTARCWPFFSTSPTFTSSYSRSLSGNIENFSCDSGPSDKWAFRPQFGMFWCLRNPSSNNRNLTRCPQPHQDRSLLRH